MINVLKYLFFLLFSISLAAQSSIGSHVQNVQELLNAVETGKLTYRQDLRLASNDLFTYTLNQIDIKGKEKEFIYNFSFADIDINTIRSITKKDAITVQLLVHGKQKFIQQISNNGDKLTYQSEMVFYAENADNARGLVKTIKELIPLAIAVDEKRLALNSYQGHIKWLSENIFDVELPKNQVIQKVNVDQTHVGHFSLDLTINEKSKTINNLYELNLSILNPNSITYKISGEEFSIEAVTRRNIKGIKYSKDGVQKDYISKLRIIANTITNGKDLYKVLKAIIPLAEEQFNKTKAKVASSSDAMAFLNKAIVEVTTGEESLSQNLSNNDNVTTYKLTETKPNESNDFEFNFNFADINGNNVDYDGAKDRLYVELPVKKAVKFVRTSKNGEVQNYTNGIKMYFNTIEDAIIGKEAIQNLIIYHEKQMETNSYNYSSMSTAVANLKKETGKVIIGEDAHDVFIELSDAKTSTLKLTTVFSNLKKSIETIQEFSINDINEKNITIEVSGKRVWVELNTKHLEKIIKTYVDGQIKPYQYKVIIEAKNVENAREIAKIFTAMAANNK